MYFSRILQVRKVSYQRSVSIAGKTVKTKHKNVQLTELKQTVKSAFCEKTSFQTVKFYRKYPNYAAMTQFYLKEEQLFYYERILVEFKRK